MTVKNSLFLSVSLILATSQAFAGETAVEAAKRFAAFPGPKAFAASPARGAWGYQYGTEDLEQAKTFAIKNCSKWAKDCQVYIENNRSIRPLVSIRNHPATITLREDGKSQVFKSSLVTGNIFTNSGSLRFDPMPQGFNCSGSYKVEARFVYRVFVRCGGQTISKIATFADAKFDFKLGNRDVLIDVKMSR